MAHTRFSQLIDPELQLSRTTQATRAYSGKSVDDNDSDDDRDFLDQDISQLQFDPGANCEHSNTARSADATRRSQRRELSSCPPPSRGNKRKSSEVVSPASSERCSDGDDDDVATAAAAPNNKKARYAPWTPARPKRTSSRALQKGKASDEEWEKYEGTMRLRGAGLDGRSGGRAAVARGEPCLSFFLRYPFSGNPFFLFPHSPAGVIMAFTMCSRSFTMDSAHHY